jgi:hypothetical protein
MSAVSQVNLPRSLSIYLPETSAGDSADLPIVLIATDFALKNFSQATTSCLREGKLGSSTGRSREPTPATCTCQSPTIIARIRDTLTVFLLQIFRAKCNLVGNEHLTSKMFMATEVSAEQLANGRGVGYEVSLCGQVLRMTEIDNAQFSSIRFPHVRILAGWFIGSRRMLQMLHRRLHLGLIDLQLRFPARGPLFRDVVLLDVAGVVYPVLQASNLLFLERVVILRERIDRCDVCEQEPTLQFELLIQECNPV